VDWIQLAENGAQSCIFVVKIVNFRVRKTGNFLIT